MYNKRLWHSLPLAGTQTCARLRHFCTHVCAPYLEVTTVRFWHKAEIRRSGTFHESCGAINLQHVVRSGCNVVVN